MTVGDGGDFETCVAFYATGQDLRFAMGARTNRTAEPNCASQADNVLLAGGVVSLCAALLAMC